MATTIRAQVTLESKSLLPEDGSINVWHFRTLTDDPAVSIAEINPALDTFYTSIESIYCANTITGNWSVKYYDLSDAEPRTPIDIASFTSITPTTGDGLPTECAIAMSFEGALTSGTIRRRRAGRLFLGPLSNGVTTTVTGYVQVSSVAKGVISDAALEIATSAELDFTVWSVFSPTAAGAKPWSSGAIAAATTDVDHGWIDNAFDTQRRRGTKASDRATWSI